MQRFPAIRWLSIYASAPLLFGAPLSVANDQIDSFAFQTEQFSKTSSSIRAAVPLNDGLLDTTGIASLDSRAGNFIRLESALNLEIDAKRVRLGDTVSNPGVLGSAVRFAGVQIGTPGQRTDLLDANRLALKGTAIVPTAVDAMLSGKSHADKFSGRGLTLQRKPQMTQANLAFAAKDSLGQTKSLNRTLLPTFSAPESGCDNYSLGLGRARVDYGLTSNGYGPWFANSTLVCALDSGLAMEAHGEYLDGENGIAGVSVFKPVGSATASVSVAKSENLNGSGWLMGFGLQHRNERFDFNVRGHVQSPEYREVGAPIQGDSVEQRFVASAGATLTERSTVSLAYINQSTYGLHETKTLAVSNRIDLGTKGAISIVADRAVDAGKAGNTDDTSMTVSYSRKLKK